MTDRSRLLLLFALMAGVVVFVAGMSLAVLYGAAVNHERGRLMDLAEHQRDMVLSNISPGHTAGDGHPPGAHDTEGGRLDTAKIMGAMHMSSLKMGEAGEYLVGWRTNDKITFYVPHGDRHGRAKSPMPAPFDSKLSEPMRRALAGLTGTVIARDYAGDQVLAAHLPLPGTDFGIVAKIDMTAIRAPFVRAAAVTGAGAAVILLLGVVLFRRISTPLVERLEQSVQSLSQAQRIAQVGNWERDVTTGEVQWSDEMFHIFGVDRATFRPTLETLLSLFDPENRSGVRDAINRSINTGVPLSAYARIARPDGEERFIHVLGECSGGDPAGSRRIAGTVQDITDWKRAVEALEESEERFRAVIEHAPEAINIKGLDGRYITANRLYCNWLRIKPEEILGKTPHELFDAELADGIAAQDDEVTAKGNVITVEREVTHADGITRYLRVHKFPIYSSGNDCTAIGTIIDDITESNKAEQALRKSEALFRAVVDHSPTKIHLKDTDGRYLLINKEAEKLFGISDAEGRGKLTHDLFPKEVADAFIDHDRQVMAGGNPVDMEEEFTLADGAHTYLTVKFPIYDGDDVAGVGAIGTDVTERRREEEQTVARSEQMKMIADLGRRALENIDLQQLFDTATQMIAQALSVDYCKILKLLPGGEEMRLVSGTGWQPGLVGTATVGTGGDSQAGFTLRTKGAVVVEDLSTETRFSGPLILSDHGVVSGISVIIGDTDAPYGVLGVHTTSRRDFTADEVTTLEGVAVVLASTIIRDHHLKTIEASEQRLRGAIDSLQEGFALFDVDDRLIAFNDVYRRLNPDADAILAAGGTFEDGLRARVRDGIITDAEGREEAFVRERMESHRNPGNPVIRHNSDGTTFLIQEVQTPEGGIATTFFDITDLKRAEAKLVENETRFKAVIENLPSYFSLKDLDGRYLLNNHEHARVFDADLETVAGQSVRETLSARLSDAVIEHDCEAITTKSVVTREREMKVDGENKFYLVTKFPIADASGAITTIGTLGTDITGLKQTESQLLQSAKLATLGQMASGIAHELNQPLNIIRMAAESALMRIEDGMVDADVQEEKLNQIEGQAARMAEIIDHMRVFVREDRADVKKTFPPADSVENALTLLEQQFAASGIDLVKNLSGVKGLVRGAPVQLEQVVMNLLSNARQAVVAKMAAQAAADSLLAGRIAVDVEEDSDKKTLTIAITDNGGGIPPEVRAHIFDPFYTTKAEGEGTGLGLSISYKIIEGMGGWLDAVDVEGGTRFEIVLPQVAKPTKRRKKAQAKKKAQAGNEIASSNGRRVLVVDDEVMAAEGLAEYLQRKGFDVATASDGNEALALFEERAADVVITDLRMPGMDGYELIRRLRETHPALPILVTTGHTTIGDDEEVVAEGATCVIKKPISLREIMDRLDGTMRQGGSAAG